MRREEIEAPFRALLEGLCEADLGPARAQVNQGKSQPAVARFKDDRPRGDLARIAPQLRRLPLSAPASLTRKHSGRDIAGIVPATNPWSCWNLAAAPFLR
jgi:hypothetical protein